MSLKNLIAFALAAIPVWGLVGCSSTNKIEAACTAGVQQACECGGGVMGTQTCRDDASGFDACSCGGNDGGGTGGGGGGGGTGGAGTGGGTGTGLSCETYCRDIMANCQGTDIQWTNLDTCMGACPAFNLGTETDESGNTLGCRHFFARGAANDPAGNCVKAGPSGAGSCGSECDGYCTLMQNICPGSFTDPGTCSEKCLAYTVAGPYDATIVTGDSRECRTYHVSVAAENAPATAAIHCPHSGETPTANCVQ